MAADYTKVLLTGSTNGRMIKVVQTATPGTLIHTAVAGVSSLHELWIVAVNTDVVVRKLTIEKGGTTAPDDLIEYKIPPESGFVEIISGQLLQNSLVIRAFAETANVIMIDGFVNLIVPS